MGLFSNSRLYSNLPVPEAPKTFDLNILRNPIICNFRFPNGANFRTDISQNMREAQYYTSPARNHSDFSEFEKLIGSQNQFDEKRAASYLSRINVNCKAQGTQKTLLHVAAERGNIAATAFLMAAGICIDAVDKEKNTPLMDAVKNNHMPEIQLLVESGANIFARNENAENALDLAKKQTGTLSAQYLNSQKPYLSQQLDHYASQVHNSAKMKVFEKQVGSKRYKANLEDILKVLDASQFDSRAFNKLCDTIDINKSHYLFGNTVMHEAAKRGHIAAIDALLARGASLEVYDSGRNTPLLVAAMFDQNKAVAHLFKNGANIFARDVTNKGVMQVIANKDSRLYDFLEANIGSSIF